MVPGSILMVLMDTMGKRAGKARSIGKMGGGMVAGAAGGDAGARAGGRENSANDVTMIVVSGAHSNCGPAHSPYAVIRHWLCPTAPFGDESVSTCELMLSG